MRACWAREIPFRPKIELPLEHRGSQKQKFPYAELSRPVGLESHFHPRHSLNGFKIRCDRHEQLELETTIYLLDFLTQELQASSKPEVGELEHT